MRDLLGRRRIPFPWSWSRHRAFKKCTRYYWYQYYGARGGWGKKASDEAREVYRLKRLLGRGQWIGQRVHSLAEELLKALQRGRDPREAAQIGRLMSKAEEECAQARKGMGRIDPRRYTDFEILEFEGDPGDQYWSDALAELRDQAEALVTHPVYRRLKEVPSRIVEVEVKNQFWIEDVRLFAPMDCLVRGPTGELIVVDWKTGRAVDPKVVADQLAIYGTFVGQKYGIAPHRIKGLWAETRRGEHGVVAFDEERQREIVSLITISAGEMLGMLDESGKDRVDRERSECLPEGDPACSRCVYRRLCWDAD